MGICYCAIEKPVATKCLPRVRLKSLGLGYYQDADILLEASE